MTIIEAQKKVNEQIMSYGGYWGIGSMFLRLIEEVGELARAINIKFGDKKPKSSAEEGNLESEIADVFYTTLAISNNYKVDFSQNIPNYFNINTKDDISKIQGELNKSEEVDKLMLLPKLIKKIGDFSELVLITDNNVEINYNITSMIIVIIEIASELDIDLANEFIKKVGNDESKMATVYGGSTNK